MFKFRSVLIMAVVLMATILSATIVFGATPEVTLCPEQQLVILQLQAAGKIAEADSMKIMYTDQLKLEQVKANAQAELDKIAAKEKADREAVWAQSVAKLSFEESLEWAQSDTTGQKSQMITWLSNRWVTRYNFAAPDSGATIGMILGGLIDQVDERREQARVRAEIDSRVVTVISPLRDELQAQIDAGTRADVNMARRLIEESDRNAELACQLEALSAKVAELEGRQDVTDDRLDEIEQSADRVLELMGYGKYNRTPENAERVRKFVAGK